MVKFELLAESIFWHPKYDHWWSVVRCLIDELQSPEELCPPCSCPAHSQRTLALDRSQLVSVPRAWHPPPDHTESSLPTADPNYLRHDGLLINQMILSRGWWLLNGSNSIRKLCFFLLSILFAATSIIDLLCRVWIWMVWCEWLIIIILWDPPEKNSFRSDYIDKSDK